MFSETKELPFTNVHSDSVELPFGNSQLGSQETSLNLPVDSLDDDNCLDVEALLKKARNTKVLRRCPEGQYVTVTDPETGERFYLRMRGANALIQTDHLYRRTGMLDRNFKEVYDEAYELQHKRSIEKAMREDENIEINNSISRNLTLSDQHSTSQEANHSLLSKSKLWVDKYAPKLYTELLSDDGVNRKLLKWLKLWDPVVFGVEAPKYATKPENSSHNNNNNNNYYYRNNDNKHDTSKQNQIADEFTLDETDRPRHKLALLCGSPGLGKTTLAHVIAEHAGYDVVEVNASDDRSPEVFSSRIEATTQTLSSITKAHRPQCLILDEIDGAPQSSIALLVNIVSGKGKKNKASHTLSRPIICICNDIYANALRQLKSVSLVLHFPQTVTTKLSNRLGHICSEEMLSSNISALMLLCERSDNDIRSCLNSLQYISNLTQDISMELISSKVADRKDAHKTLFELWKDVFHLPATRKRRPDMNSVVSSQRGSTSRFDKIYFTSCSTGEYEKATMGIYENFLKQKVQDSYLESGMEALDWLAFYDRFNTFILTNQQYSLLAYLPYISVLFHFLYSSPKLPYLSYPNKYYENTQHRAKHSQTLQALTEGTLPLTRVFLFPDSLNMDILPYLLTIVSPTMRPINTQLYSAREKHQLSDLVDTMICYNLTYKQELATNGQYEYVFDPSVEEIVHFAALQPRVYLSYGAKQLISREVEVEKMIRAEQLSKRPICRKETEETSEGNKKSGHFMGLTNLYKSNPTSIATVEETRHAAKDFFGRIIDTSKNPKNTNKIQMKYSKFYIKYRYNEGVTDAIRRQIKIKDFM